MVVRSIFLILPALLLAGCSLFGATGPEPTPTVGVTAVPTFTPTVAPPQIETTPTATEVAAGPEPEAAIEAAQAESAPTEEEAPASLVILPSPTPQEASGDAAVPEEAEADANQSASELTGPQLVVSGEIVNVRQGPGTNYATVGTVVAGESYALTGRNEAGDWWQVCCFDEAPGWLYGPLVTLQQSEAVALASDIPPAPTATPASVAAEAPATDAPEADPAVAEATPEPAEEPPSEPAAEPTEIDYNSGTAGVFDPNAQYHIIGHRVLGFYENNGGIFNNGGQHMIFINVVDQNGNGIDGAVIRNKINHSLNRDIVTGSKGPGRAEFETFGIRHKLYVASDPSGPVTSQVTNQMDTVWPHIPDIVGMLGPPEEELAICPTIDDRCEPPFYHAHWSYEVTFQKTK